MEDYHAHIEAGINTYGRMLDLDDAHIDDAVRVGMRAAVESYAQQHAGAVEAENEPFAAFVRRVAPEHAHLILAEIQRETDASHERATALASQLRGAVEAGNALAQAAADVARVALPKEPRGMKADALRRLSEAQAQWRQHGSLASPKERADA